MQPQATSSSRFARLFRTASRNAGELLTQPIGRRYLARAHGGYYAVTGVWPFLHMRSFEAVTGPKTDHWLVQTVGALVGVLGGALLAVSFHDDGPSRDLAATAITSAVVLALLDSVFVAQRRVAPVYLLDAAAECVLIAGWMTARRGPQQPG